EDLGQTRARQLRGARATPGNEDDGAAGMPYGGDGLSCRRDEVTLHSYTHGALRVERLQEAEVFYSELFALDVAWREAETPRGWYTLPEWAGWDDAAGAGGEVGAGTVRL